MPEAQVPPGERDEVCRVAEHSAESVRPAIVNPLDERPGPVVAAGDWEAAAGVLDADGDAVVSPADVEAALARKHSEHPAQIAPIVGISGPGRKDAP